MGVATSTPLRDINEGHVDMMAFPVNYPRLYEQTSGPLEGRYESLVQSFTFNYLLERLRRFSCTFILYKATFWWQKGLVLYGFMGMNYFFLVVFSWRLNS